ncbi:hypothetical protein vBSlqSZDD2_17 [Serratia phage vB_SlqS_ZDD2]|nr:hypothetical protein vBSlqSZDD2_17 [Serratia phage vB_SlqS_ZDD2]
MIKKLIDSMVWVFIAAIAALMFAWYGDYTNTKKDLASVSQENAVLRTSVASLSESVGILDREQRIQSKYMKARAKANAEAANQLEEARREVKQEMDRDLNRGVVIPASVIERMRREAKTANQALSGGSKPAAE